ncbi:MAG TPA: HlyD family efflux transporter periplasmic adaptor subunit [Bryobacteraceae bacterium]|nr:HlyD family efflux transporter periplasmic adaptor subunit [Bryobacteraceae bacterium]
MCEPPYRNLFGAILLITAAVTASCTARTEAVNASAPPPPPAVSVISVQPEDVPIINDYAAQTFARDMVEVRGRVDGYIEKRLFEAGTDVPASRPLFELDKRPYIAEVEKAKAELQRNEANLEFARRQVALTQAEADLSQARANLTKSRQDVERLKPLVAQDAASRQDLEDALAALQGSEAIVRSREANVQQTRLSAKAQIDVGAAQVGASRAQLRAAELNLEYATIRAPIGGRVGESLVPVGGLVNRSSPQPLTTIVPLDRIWVRFQVSESEHLRFMRAQRSTEGAAVRAAVGASG